jgi:hypothetical protein
MAASKADRPDAPQAGEGLSLADIMAGKGVPFVVDGKTLHIRQPTTEEYDDALWIQGVARRRALARPDIAALKGMPISDAERDLFERMIAAAEAAFEVAEEGSPQKKAMAERAAALRRVLETRTLADEVAEERAILERDRFLALRLICDENGEQMFDPNKPEDRARWERAPMRLKDAARRAIWEMLQAIESLPFE